MDLSKLFSFEEQLICLMMNDIQFEPFSLAKPNSQWAFIAQNGMEIAQKSTVSFTNFNNGNL